MENRFSKEDMKNLFTHLSEQESVSYGVSDDISRAMNIIEFNDYSYNLSISDSPLLLDALKFPYEELPLHINCSCSIDEIIIKWRLKRGK